MEILSGGEDFDMRVIEYLIDEFKKDQGIDLSKDSLALQRLKEAAEKPKSNCLAVHKLKSTCLHHHMQREQALSVKNHAEQIRAPVEDLVDRTIDP